MSQDRRDPELRGLLEILYVESKIVGNPESLLICWWKMADECVKIWDQGFVPNKILVSVSMRSLFKE